MTHIAEKKTQRWDTAFRVLIVFWAIFTVCLLPWSIWVTKSIFESNVHVQDSIKIFNRLDKIDKDIEEVKKDVAYLPPIEWRTRIIGLENTVHSLPPDEWRERIIKLEDWDRENREAHMAILVSLKAIEAKLEIMSPGS